MSKKRSKEKIEPKYTVGDITNWAYTTGGHVQRIVTHVDTARQQYVFDGALRLNFTSVDSDPFITFVSSAQKIEPKYTVGDVTFWPYGSKFMERVVTRVDITGGEYTFNDGGKHSISTIDKNSSITFKRHVLPSEVETPPGFYVPVVGDLVAFVPNPHEVNAGVYEVKAVTDEYVIIVRDGSEWPHHKGNCTLYKIEAETLITERWFNIYGSGVIGSNHLSLADAQRHMERETIATIHVYGTQENPQVEIIKRVQE